ncbi:MAG TPA: cytochrome C oxidase subunit IV family protein [Dehalococcoidia bacterium]|nr:cytochrome C oxidase subunit IV family protein [Dehalococcoidia bacterium]
MTMQHRWRSDRESAMSRAEALHEREEHPSQTTYIGIALILGVLTLIEVWTYYIDGIQDVLPPILIVLAIAKFALVAGWFMHLRFDSTFYTVMFAGGLVLAAAAFVIVLAVERALFV